LEKIKWVSPESHEKLVIADGKIYDSKHSYQMLANNILDLTFPPSLNRVDEISKNFYEGRADDYERYLHLTFQTYGEDEEQVREKMIDLLELKEDSRVLEVACGTGRDSVLIAKRLGRDGQLYLTDISPDMLTKAAEKLKNSNKETHFCVSNAMHLPCPDNYFDAFYSFGALGEFSDPARFFSEVIRVCKPGAKVVVGDENLPPWQRSTLFGQVLANYNKQFLAEVPFSSLPTEAREVRCQWIIGGVFYLIDFRVGEGEPYADFEFQIPGPRGGTHKTRFYGQLEGVKESTRNLAWEARAKLGISMHEWLDDLVNREAKKVLDGKDGL
jgi:ubiquinone/menaquinone biosynthesis C-methylase UbiE